MSMGRAQGLAAQAVAAVDAGRNLNDVLAEIWQQHPQLAAAEKGALQDMAYGCLRQRGLLQQVLRQMLRTLPDAAIHSLLLVALYQLHATRNAPHAVVNEAVTHAGRIARGRYKNLVNAVLRRFLREHHTLLQAALHHEEARYNLPQWWLGYLRHHYPQHWQHIAEAYQQHPPMTLRINCRRSDAHAYCQTLADAGMQASILGSHTVRLHQPVPVQALPGFADGVVSVQDWGAQQAALMLQPQAGERIVDACAAPGGKSGHLRELADCRLTAIDVDAQRLLRIRDNLNRLGLNADLHVADAQQTNTWYDGHAYDAVLADVPCTASGVVRRHPDIKWLRQPHDARQTAEQQAPLLDALWQVLRPGGRMLLATCSIFVEENQQQLARFLARHADARCRETRILLPDPDQDGFFYALIDKQSPAA